jgi:hypothetical protein
VIRLRKFITLFLASLILWNIALGKISERRNCEHQHNQAAQEHPLKPEESHPVPIPAFCHDLELYVIDVVAPLAGIPKPPERPTVISSPVFAVPAPQAMPRNAVRLKPRDPPSTRALQHWIVGLTVQRR